MPLLGYEPDHLAVTVLRLKYPYTFEYGKATYAFVPVRDYTPYMDNPHTADASHMLNIFGYVADYQKGHEMNFMVVYDKGRASCKAVYGKYTELAMGDKRNLFTCYSITRDNYALGNMQGPMADDNGAGVFLRGTNILVGVSSSAVPKINTDPSASVPVATTAENLGLRLIDYIHSYLHEEFDQFPEFHPVRGAL